MNYILLEILIILSDFENDSNYMNEFHSVKCTKIAFNNPGKIYITCTP